MSKQLKISDEQFEELRRTGTPLVIPVGGGSEVVVQDAEAYRRMVGLLEEIDLAKSGQVCSERWGALEEGSDAGVSPEAFFADIRRRVRRTG